MKTFLTFCIGLAFAALAAPAHGNVLDWNTTGAWAGGAPTAGAVTNSYNSGAVTVTLAQSGSATWLGGSPSIDATRLQGGTTGQNALQLAVDDQSSASSYIEITIKFAYPAKNVSFSIWDVDRAIDQQRGIKTDGTPGSVNNTGNSYEDLISDIQGKSPTNTTVYPTTLTAHTDNKTNLGGQTATGVTVTTGSSAGGGENNALATGNVDISFGSQEVSSVTFRWSNPFWSTSFGGNQYIAIANINYDPTPEVHPAFAAMGLCCGLLFLGRRRTRSDGLSKAA